MSACTRLPVHVCQSFGVSFFSASFNQPFKRAVQCSAARRIASVSLPIHNLQYKSQIPYPIGIAAEGFWGIWDFVCLPYTSSSRLGIHNKSKLSKTLSNKQAKRKGREKGSEGKIISPAYMSGPRPERERPRIESVQKKKYLRCLDVICTPC